MPLSLLFASSTETISPFSTTTVMCFRTLAFSVSTTCTFVNTCRGAGGRIHGGDTMSKSSGTGCGIQCGGSQSSGLASSAPLTRRAETALDASKASSESDVESESEDAPRSSNWPRQLSWTRMVSWDGMGDGRCEIGSGLVTSRRTML